MHTCRQTDDSRVTIIDVQTGWHVTESGMKFAKTKKHKTEWLPIVCGNDLRATDPDCVGCRRATVP